MSIGLTSQDRSATRWLQRLKATFEENHSWLGNCAQTVAAIFTPSVALAAVTFAWIAHKNTVEIAATSLQESNFNRTLDITRYVVEFLAREEAARGMRCVRFLSKLPDSFIQKHFPSEGSLFKEEIVKITLLEANDKSKFVALQKDLGSCIGLPHDKLGGHEDYLKFARLYIGYLNALNLGLSTWVPIDNQQKLTSQGKRTAREFCYVEKNYASLCRKDHTINIFLKKYLTVSKNGGKKLEDRYPDLINFYKNYCNHTFVEKQREECEKIG
jgi:hypothetical protein